MSESTAFSSTVASIKEQIDTVSSAPIPFLTALFSCSVIIWVALNWYFNGKERHKSLHKDTSEITNPSIVKGRVKPLNVAPPAFPQPGSKLVYKGFSGKKDIELQVPLLTTIEREQIINDLSHLIDLTERSYASFQNDSLPFYTVIHPVKDLLLMSESCSKISDEIKVLLKNIDNKIELTVTKKHIKPLVVSLQNSINNLALTFNELSSRSALFHREEVSLEGSRTLLYDSSIKNHTSFQDVYDNLQALNKMVDGLRR